MDIPTNNVSVIEDENGLRTQRLFAAFITDFRDAKDETIYADAAAELVNPERNTLFVQFPDIHSHSASLASSLELNFCKYYPFLCHAVQQVVIEKCRDEATKQRLNRKEFYVSILNLPNKHLVRELTADKIGSLLRISGQVVRTHPVHPELGTGTFVCDDCGVTIRNIVQQFKYTPPNKCANPQCQNRSRFSLDVFNSQFVDFQRLRIQETQDELPRGCIPRNVEVIVHGEMVETAQPGDHCDFTGTLIVIPDVAVLAAPGIRAELNNRARGKNNTEAEGLQGLKALGVRDLNYKLAFLACSITSSNPTFGEKEFTHEEVDHMELWNSMKPADQRRLKEMSEDKNIEQHLIHSLFPNIFGYDEIKLGILLMLFGGVLKRANGINLRGDINVLMVGDPSCGKSQFLKTVEKFSPRVIYTSGKASSAAGLTAAVVKDEESFDFVIEAGALMLADNGVCCIDEFDKMDPKDQVAIHEAMEQQTISITKAGVKATLNARCSILAAANPINGRYDRSRTVKQNVQLTDPILSRFDLLFVLVDDPTERNEAIDFAIAKRILDNHTLSYRHAMPDTTYKVEDIRKYIMFAKCFKPKISDEAAEALKSEYKKLRLGEGNGMQASNWRITVRQLESLIRISEALARLHCDDKITVEYVSKASRFLEKSIHRVTQPDISLEDEDDMDLMDDQMEVDGEPRVLRERNVSEEPEASEQQENMEAGDQPPAKKQHIDPARLKISFDVYKRISNLLVLHIRALEEKEEDNEDWEGMKQSLLVEWYLEQIESDLTTVEEYHVQKTICERIVRRLIHDDNILIQLNPEEEDPTLVVHPGYVVE